jgi:hypothetical protein
MCRKQGFVDAPVDVVWDLIADVERHPEWWPRVIEVHCEGLDEGCTYRQVTQTPFGKDKMNLLIENRDELRNLSIRCINSGTFVRFGLTGAQDGTFVDGEMGMDPTNLRSKLIDVTIGRRYFSEWLESTLEAIGDAARGRVGDPGLEPGTSSLSEKRSNRLS